MMAASVPAPVHPTYTRTLAFAALAVAGGVWGTGFLFCKIALEELSVPHMLFYRLMFAAAGFIPLLFLRHVRFSAKDWKLLLIASFFGVPGMFIIQFEGLARTTVSHAALMVGTSPIILVLGAALVFGERITPVIRVALAASTLGVFLILGPGVHHTSPGTVSSPTVVGDLLVIASMLGGAVWVLISKHLTKRYPSTAVTAYVMTIGAIMLAAWVLITDGPPPVTLPTHTWLVLLGAGFLSTVLTTVLWNWGLTHVQASHAAIFLNFEPVVGAILGVTILHDALGISTIVGGLLIVSSAAVISWYES